MTKISRRILSSTMAGTLALALAACSAADEADAELAGEPIAAIPAPDGQQWTDIVSVTEEGGFLLGNPDAPLKLVEYASHTCGACANFSINGAPPLKKDYVSTGVVSIELRNLVRDPIDLTIATLVRCGPPENMQPLSDQAWIALNDIFANINANGAAYEAAGQLPSDQRFIAIAQAAGLIDFFAARGLSSEQARSCLADGANIEAIATRSQQQAQEFQVNSTPTFFLNGSKLEVNQWPGLEPVLQRAGAR
jgi:protein-disulfide isomerase